MPMIDVTEILRFAGVAFLLGFIGMLFKKFEVGKEISELIMLAGYVYLLVFIVQLIEVLMTSLRTIFML
ncbi:MAG: SpoIIIAC/SpoIIIAD family protein [Turicibacter sp.]|nr:SpoIIIAC/SpoIIIAD family protein [Turicibacter sp.]MDO5792772.1 SpoIIIAC/SpoIIIAD family protein [Turicibacter sp.]